MTVTIHTGDALDVLRTLPPDSVDCCVTSPPYWLLRDADDSRQIGQEHMYGLYIHRLIGLFGEVWRVLTPSGVCWVNIGDRYMNDDDLRREPKHRPRKFDAPTVNELIGLPWMFAFDMRREGWFLRSEVIWHKTNGQPESVKKRPTRNHEHIFMFSKSTDYYYDREAVREPAVGGRHDASRSFRRQNSARGTRLDRSGRSGSHRPDRADVRYDGDTRLLRGVWSIGVAAHQGHNAVFPREIARRCILAACPEGGVVLDPFLGSGTTAIVAASLGRHCIGIEIKPEYVALAERRVHNEVGLLAGAEA